MDASEVVRILAQVIVTLIGGLVVSLVGAVVLRAAAQWIAKLDVTFDQAFWTVFLSLMANLALDFVLGFVGVAGSVGPQDSVRVQDLILLPVGFLIQSEIIKARLKLSFGRACLVSLTMAGIYLGIYLAVVLLMMIFTNLAG